MHSDDQKPKPNDNIMKYTSITRNFRGYNYYTDWQTSDEWREEMKRQEQADNEVEWSVLVFVHSGMPVLQFSRGREIILRNW